MVLEVATDGSVCGSEEKKELTADEWLAVLKLSNRWDMPDTHAQAIKGLEETDQMTAGRKLILAQRFAVLKWFDEGFAAFVTRREQISVAERDELGWETYARLLEAKDKAHPALPPTSADLEKLDCETLLKEVFDPSWRGWQSWGSGVRRNPMPLTSSSDTVSREASDSFHA